MRLDKFMLILKQLTFLADIRDIVILQKCNYKSYDIKKDLKSDKLKRLEFIEIFDSVWRHEII